MVAGLWPLSPVLPFSRPIVLWSLFYANDGLVFPVSNPRILPRIKLTPLPIDLALFSLPEILIFVI